MALIKSRDERARLSIEAFESRLIITPNWQE
jgi:hypothetical protein